MDVGAEPTLTAADVVAMTGFSRSHVYRHPADFGAIKVGGAIRFRRTVVLALIAAPQNSAPAGVGSTAGA